MARTMSLVTASSLVLALGAVATSTPVSATPVNLVGFGFNGTVNSVATGSDGTTYVGGDFTQYAAFTGGAALVSATTGAVNTTSFPQVNGHVLAVEPDGAGGWFVGGSFTSIGGSTRNGFAWIDANGTVESFVLASGPGITTVRALKLIDSTLYVGYETNSGTVSYRLAAISLSGGSVPTLPTVNGSVLTIAADSTGLFIGGSFTNVGVDSRAGLARINRTTGALDAAWIANVSGGSATVHALAVDSTELYVGGSFTSIGTHATASNLAKVSTSTGVPVTTWVPSPNNVVRALAFAGTELYIGGDFTRVGVSPNDRAADRLALIGKASGSFVWMGGINGTSVNALAYHNATLYVAGEFQGQSVGFRLNALSIDNSRNTTSWDPSLTAAALAPSATPPSSAANAIAVSGDSVLIGGTFTRANSVTREGAAALTSTGALVENWNPVIRGGSVNAVAVSGDLVYLGGTFDLTKSAGAGPPVRLRNIARITTSGAWDGTWRPDSDGRVNAIVTDTSGVYVGGTFTSIGGQTRSNLAKLDPSTGSAVPGWAPAANAPVSALAVDRTNNRLLVGGTFTEINGAARGRGAGVNLNTGALNSWNPAFNNEVTSITVAGKAAYFGGLFTDVASVTTADYIARFYGDTFDTGFTPGPSSAVLALSTVNGTVVVGGTFSTLGGTSRGFLGAVGSSGALVSSWTPTVSSSVSALATTPSGTIAAGGSFSSSQGGSNTGFGAATFTKPPGAGPLSATPLAFSDITVGGTANLAITVTNSGELPATISEVDITAVTQRAGSCTTGTTIPPAGSCVVNVAWTPSSVGTLTSAAALIVEYANGSVSDFFSITGRSVAPSSPGGGGNGGSSPPPPSDSVSGSTPTAHGNASQVKGPNRSLILRPGEVAAIVDGVREPALGRAGRGNESLIVTGGGSMIDVPSPRGLGGSGAPRWQPGLSASLDVSRFQPGSVTDAYLLSTPQLIGSATATPTGAGSIAITVPPTMKTGAHTLQVVGTDSRGRSLIIAVGLTVEREPKTIGTRVYFPLGSSKLTRSAKATVRAMIAQAKTEGMLDSSSSVSGIVRLTGAKARDIERAKQRSRAVSAYMKSLGFTGDVQTTTTRVAARDRWTDRRVDVIIER